MRISVCLFHLHDCMSEAVRFGHFMPHKTSLSDNLLSHIYNKKSFGRFISNITQKSGFFRNKKPHIPEKYRKKSQDVVQNIQKNAKKKR